MEVEISNFSSHHEPPFSDWDPEVLQKVKHTLSMFINQSMDMATLQKELQTIAGSHLEQLPGLISQLTGSLTQAVASKAAAQNSGFSAPNLGQARVVQNGSHDMAPVDRMDVDVKGEPIVEETVELSDLSEGDRAKLAFIADVQSIFNTAEASGLVQGFMKGEISFLEMAHNLPAAFLKQPPMIERAAILTDNPTQSNQLKDLYTATSRLCTHINTIPLSLRRQACFEVSDLILHHKLPKRSSQTREFVNYACKKVVPDFVAVPRVAQLPMLLSDDNEVTSHPPPQTTSNTTTTIDSSPPHITSEPPKTTPLGPSKSSLSVFSPGPSYTQRPATYSPPLCTMRDDLGDSVLNDFFHCAGSGSEGSSQDNINNPHQDALFRLEEDALCLDIMIGRLQSSVRVLEEISHRLALLASERYVYMANTNGTKIKAMSAIEVINGSLLAIHIDTFKTVARNRTTVASVDPILLFHADPLKFILEMTRLCMFQADEHAKTRKCFGLLWKHVFARQYVPMLDHRVYRMKNDDKHLFNPKAVVSHLNMRYHEAFSAGRASCVDFLSAEDFVHFHHQLLPFAINTKSTRDNQLAKESKMDDSSSFSDLPNLIDPTVLESIKKDIIQLLSTAGERILSQNDNMEMSAWLNETFQFLIRIPSPADWQSNPVRPSMPTLLYGPLQFYTVIKMFHTLHERIRLAFYLSHQFSGSSWQFSNVTPPSCPDPMPPNSKLFPQYFTSTERTPEASVSDSFPSDPPTPFVELSTLFVDSNPGFIANWEADAAPLARMTRAGASSSTVHMLGGPPPQGTPWVGSALLRQAAQLRNLPWISRPGHQMSTDATSSVQDLATASLPPLPDPALNIPAAERYHTFLSLLRKVLMGQLDANNYDSSVMKLLGQNAYPLYTTHRLITNLVSQIRLMMTLPERQVWYDLWAKHSKSIITMPPTTTENFEKRANQYLNEAHIASAGYKFVEMRMNALGTLTFQVHQGSPHTPTANGSLTNSTMASWEAYVKSWNSPRLDGIDIRRRRLFLRRNVALHLPEHLKHEPLFGRAPSWDLANALQQIRQDFVSSPAPHGVFDPITCKLTREAFVTDFSYRKSRIGSKGDATAKTSKTIPTSASASNPESLIHRTLSNLPLKHAAPTTDHKDELDLIQRIHKQELERADHVVTDDKIASRVRRRLRIPKNSGSMDVDVNGHEESDSGSSGESDDS